MLLFFTDKILNVFFSKCLATCCILNIKFGLLERDGYYY